MEKYLKHIHLILLFLFGTLFIFIAFYFDGTADTGDSLTHFMISKYAFKTPYLFFFHWGKPFFTFLSAPFSQFGFIGIKFFNITIALLTGLFTYKITIELKLKRAWLVLPFIYCAPLYFINIFSGLTEPLFGLLTIVGIYLIMTNNIYESLLLISFLPFVRSEGLIIIGIFGLYLLYKKMYKWIPLLAVGHIIYTLLGVVLDGRNILWVFNKIPYATLNNVYGSGRIRHFFIKYIYVIGVPLLILFCLGLILFLISLFSKKQRTQADFPIKSILIYGSFISYFMAHVVFWKLGIFASFGLIRVMVAIVPLSAIISLEGFNFIFNQQWIKNKLLLNILSIMMIGYVFIFPFTKTPSSIDWQSDLSETTDQKLINQVAEYIHSNFPNHNVLYYTHPYISIAFDNNHYDEREHLFMNQLSLKKGINKNELIIWDEWYTVVDEGIELEDLNNNDNFEMVKSFTKNDGYNVRQFVVFKHK